MADTTAYVYSCVKTGGQVVLVLSDALGVDTNTYTATFPIVDEDGTAGDPVTIIVGGLFA
jgi:hypothetical protein